VAELQGVKRTIEVAVDGTKAIAQLKEIAKSTKELDDKLGEFGETLKKVAETMGIALGAHEIIENVKAIAEGFDQLGKDAQKVGIAADDLQRLRYAAQYAGVSGEQLQKAMTHLAEQINAIGPGTSEAAKRLKEIGVAAGSTTLQALDKIAERFAKLPDSARKTAEAVLFFGAKVGPELVPLLSQGTEGVHKAMEELDKFGTVASDKTINMASLLADKMQNLGKQSKSAGEQLVSGMLAGLIAVSGALIDSRKQSDLWYETGAKLGDLFVDLTADVLRWVGQLKALGIVVQGIFEMVNADDFTEAGKRWSDMTADLKHNTYETTTAVIKLRQEQKNASTEAEAAAAKRKADAAAQEAELKRELAAEEEKRQAEERRRLAEEAARRAREAAAAAEKLHTETVKAATEGIKAQTDAEKEYQAQLQTGRDDQIMRARYNDQDALALAVERTTKAYDDYAKQQREVSFDMQALIKMTKEGTDEQKQWAGEILESQLRLKHMADVVNGHKELVTALDNAWGRFVENLSAGTTSVAASFKAMAASIVADLMKIWAKKYIIDMIARLWGGTTTPVAETNPPGWDQPGAFGLAFSQGRTIPFAAGGVIASPVRVPMALMGEAGPEAIMPLQRTGSGALGVAATMPALNVAIHNHADATVSARRNGAGDLEVLIERTKASMATDFRRGGNDLSRAAEAAWGLTRGASAPF
jgi:hypothetical protein